MLEAKAEVVNFDNKQNLFTLLSDLKSEIEQYQSSLNEVDIDMNTFLKKEDDLNLNEKNALLEQYGVTVDSLDFDISEMSIEDLQIKLDEFSSKSDETKTEEFALNGQFMEELMDKLSIEKIESDWGSYAKYSFIDYDSEINEAYCWDRTDWKLYGFTYSVDGDVVTVDFESKTRKKFSIVDFVILYTLNTL